MCLLCATRARAVLSCCCGRLPRRCRGKGSKKRGRDGDPKAELRPDLGITGRVVMLRGKEYVPRKWTRRRTVVHSVSTVAWGAGAVARFSCACALTCATTLPVYVRLQPSLPTPSRCVHALLRCDVLHYRVW